MKNRSHLRNCIILVGLVFCSSAWTCTAAYADWQVFNNFGKLVQRTVAKWRGEKCEKGSSLAPLDVYFILRADSDDLTDLAKQIGFSIMVAAETRDAQGKERIIGFLKCTKEQFLQLQDKLRTDPILKSDDDKLTTLNFLDAGMLKELREKEIPYDLAVPGHAIKAQGIIFDLRDNREYAAVFIRSASEISGLGLALSETQRKRAIEERAQRKKDTKDNLAYRLMVEEAIGLLFGHLPRESIRAVEALPRHVLYQVIRNLQESIQSAFRSDLSIDQVLSLAIDGNLITADRRQGNDVQRVFTQRVGSAVGWDGQPIPRERAPVLLQWCVEAARHFPRFFTLYDSFPDPKDTSRILLKKSKNQEMPLLTRWGN